MSPFLILIFMIPGLIIFFLGRYIGKTGYIEILKSYNEKKNYDKDGLKNYVKRLMMGTGVTTVITALIAFVIAIVSTDEMVIGVYLLMYSAITIHYIIKLRRSCKKFEV